MVNSVSSFSAGSAVSLSSIWHWSIVIVFFVANLLVYEFLVFGVGMLIATAIINNKKIPEEVSDGIVSVCVRLCFMIIAVLMLLWCLGVFRLIPIPH